MVNYALIWEPNKLGKLLNMPSVKIDFLIRINTDLIFMIQMLLISIYAHVFTDILNIDLKSLLQTIGLTGMVLTIFTDLAIEVTKGRLVTRGCFRLEGTDIQRVNFHNTRLKVVTKLVSVGLVASGV